MTQMYKVMAYEDKFQGKIKAGDILVVSKISASPRFWRVLSGPHTQGSTMTISMLLCSNAVPLPSSPDTSIAQQIAARAELLTEAEETARPPEPKVKRREASVAYEAGNMVLAAQVDRTGYKSVRVSLMRTANSIRGALDPAQDITISPADAEDLLRVLSTYLEDQK